MRWLAGTALSILGFPLQVVALLLAPLVVVQPALAAGLLVLMWLGERILGEPAGRYEYVCVAMIVVGVVGAGLTAPPRTTTHSQELTITLVLVALAAASLVPYLLRALGRSNAIVTMVGAGLAFSWSALATKLASDDLAVGHLVPAAAWALSTAAASLVGVLSEMSALQSRPAIQVAPVVFVTQTVVPVVLAPILLGESFARTPLSGVPLGLSLSLLISGAALLARSPLLLGLMASEPVSEESGSTPSPAEVSRETIRSSPASPAGEPPISTTSTSPARTPR
jgi:drug/metabolite transporter (DMT)-like permease